VLQICPYCYKEEYCIKSGLYRNGTQRYRCQHCKHYFTHKTEEKRLAHEQGREVQIRAVRLYLEGRSLRAIARQLGVHHQTVGRWVASSSRVQGLRNIAIELYLERESVHFAYYCLSEEVSYRTVCMWIRDDLSQTLKEQALSLRLKKTPLSKIKTAIGVDDVRTVRKWIRQAKSETIDDLK
jgi:transposase-like protein